ncbi:MAG TPA: hypothetical protein PK078_13185 [Anaerolineales bacterium]|nr:hypothetical protein [Anaerolineales bacterium]HNA87820.1 hypothetical protein [Anaerolineales bacterium]HNB34886.1 hypothetical protein [Anaerolineales bacterium]HNC07147.1 hypothetical protein [Anaerolineales bacterium]
MGKYRSSVKKAGVDKKREPHFAWRGIGCLMFILIPVISWAAGYETIHYGLDHGWPIPYELLGTPTFPDFFYRSSGVMTILSPIATIQHFFAILAACLVYMVALGGILSVIYAFAYRAVAPSRYGPLDAPPSNVKVKRYKR